MCGRSGEKNSLLVGCLEFRSVVSVLHCRVDGYCFDDMETKENEEYFRSNVDDWSLLSFLKWKKEKGLELQGKAVEHNNYVKHLLALSTREAKQALELFKVHAETYSMNIWIDLYILIQP